MRVMLFYAALLFVAFLDSSCTPAGRAKRRDATAGQESSEVSPGKKALFPRVMREMPASGVLDLGPVVVTGRAGGMDTLAYLHDVAERIGADAFVLEERRVGEAYPVQTKVVNGFLETFDGRTYQVTTYIVRPAGEGMGVKETGFYRAIRFVEGESGPCRLDEDKLTNEVIALFEGVTTLREQIRRLTVLFSKGIIDAETFREVRKGCLEQKRD